MTPLTRTAAAALLGGALLAGSSNPAPALPAAPAAPTFPNPATLVPPVPSLPVRADEKSDIADLKKQLDESNKKLGDIQTQLKQLAELLNGKKDSDNIPIPGTSLLAQVKELKDRLAALETEMGKLKTSSSLRPPTPTGGSPVVAAKGTVRVVNEYPVRISMVVNGTSYRIEPTKSLDIDVPAGEFSYQLLEAGAAPTKSTIKDKETVTLRIK